MNIKINKNVIWIYAPNVHTGGAKSLISELFSSIKNFENYRFILDKRLQITTNLDNSHVLKIKPNIFSRLYAEYYIWMHNSNDDTILSFGNLPPLLKLKGFVLVYFQSLYLLKKRTLKNFHIMEKIRILLERIWLRLYILNVNLFVVQSNSVLDELKEITKNQKIIVYPFIKNNKTNNLNNEYKREGFIYVSTGDPHKNHNNLIEGWILLSKKGIFPKLKLTLDEKRDSDLLKWIKRKSLAHNLNIVNLGIISDENIQINYKLSEALIFPSIFETLGLPLLEAAQNNLPILASEKDYVRNIVKPKETFDPDSSLSIARAVERFINGDNKRLHVYSGSDFIEQLESQFKYYSKLD